MLNLHATFWRFRYFLIAATAFGVVVSIISAIERLEPETASVVVVTRALPAGTRLTDRDLETRPFPAQALPADALTDPAGADGRVLANNLPAGMPLSQQILLGEEFLAAAGEGRVVAPIKIVTDGTDSLAVSGARVALYSLPSEYEENREALLVTQDAVVTEAGPADDSGSFLSDSKNTRVIYVSITSDEASLVLGIGATASLRAVLLDPA